MGLFNINAFLEGQQAEEYKARKAEEERRKEEEREERQSRRSAANFVGYKHNPLVHNKDDEHMSNRTHVKVVDDNESRVSGKAPVTNKNRASGGTSTMDRKWRDYDQATDAVRKDMRRHPERYRECTLFEFVNFI